MITISISPTVCELQPAENLASSSLTFQGHPRSNFIAPNESPYMISYTLIIETKSVSLSEDIKMKSQPAAAGCDWLQPAATKQGLIRGVLIIPQL